MLTSKVEVSIIIQVTMSYLSRSGGIGRRSGLKIRRRQKRVGSSPTFGSKDLFALVEQISLFYIHSKINGINPLFFSP